MIKDELLNLASEYLNITKKELMTRIEKCQNNLVKDWNDKKDINDFYINTEHYIPNLINFNNEYRVDNLLHPIKYCKNLKILDYGAGLGISSLILGKSNDVHYYDINKENIKFCKFLKQKFNSNISIISEDDIEANKYDIIIIADVLEHLENPIETIKYLTTKLNKKGLLLTTGLDFSIGENVPMHLPENKNKREEFIKFITDNFYTSFFHATMNENIYLYIKKDENIPTNL